MTARIIFAEHFESDTIDSVLERYPGSRLGLAAARTLGSFALPRPATAVATTNDTILAVPEGISIQDTGSVQLVMRFNPGGSGGTSQAVKLNVFGLFIISTTSANVLSIQNPSGTQVATMPTGTLANNTLWQITIDYDVGTITWFIDSEPYMVRVPCVLPRVATLGNLVSSAATTSSVNWNAYLPTRLDSIIIADGANTDSLLSADFVKNVPTIAANQDWAYSTNSILADIDKANPKETTPFISAHEQDSTLTLATNTPQDAMATVIHSAVGGEWNVHVNLLADNVPIYDRALDNQTGVVVPPLLIEPIDEITVTNTIPIEEGEG